MDSQYALILYPRAYNKRGKADYHSVQGVTLDGRVVNIKLRIDERFRDKPSAPKISEFAREDIQAASPCIARPTNGPLSPEGILLFTDISVEEGDVYVAKWAYVLAAHSKMPAPWIGFGRMETIKASAEVQRLKAELAKLQGQTNPDPSEVQRLEEALNNPANWAHIGLVYHPKATVSVKARDVTETAICQRIAFLVDEYTRDGVSGGFLYRIRLADGTVLHGKTHEWYARRPANSASFQRGEDLAKDIWKNSLVYTLARLDPGSVVEFIPMSRISCGPSGNKFYGDSVRHQKLQDLYTSGDQLLTRAVVIRPQAYQTDPPSYLLNLIQHLDNQAGDAALLTEDGFTLRYHNDRLKPEAFGILEADLVEKPIGLWANNQCLKPANTRALKPRREPKPVPEPEVAQAPTVVPEALSPEPETAAPIVVIPLEEEAAPLTEAPAAEVAELAPAIPAAIEPEPIELLPATDAPAGIAALNDSDHDLVVAVVPVSADAPLCLDDFGSGEDDSEDTDHTGPAVDALQVATSDELPEAGSVPPTEPDVTPPEEGPSSPPEPAKPAKKGMAAFFLGQQT